MQLQQSGYRLTPAEIVEVRASQRTFEGAYVRTAISQFSFAVIVLKIFSSEFYPIGALFAVYGACVFAISAYRRHIGNQQFFQHVDHEGIHRSKFRTSGKAVIALTTLSVGAYSSLIYLLLRLDH